MAYGLLGQRVPYTEDIGNEELNKWLTPYGDSIRCATREFKLASCLLGLGGKNEFSYAVWVLLPGKS